MRQVLLIILCLLPLHLTAQETGHQPRQSHFTASIELTTKYMWRGIEYGDAPVVFPCLSYNYKGLNAYAMGGYATNGSHQEVDIGIGYSYQWLSIGLADYYYPTATGEKDKYFKLSSRETGHYIEAYTTLTPDFAPMWLTLSAYVFGADKNADGKQAYSSYAELGYHFDFDENNVLSLFAGACLNKSFYTDYSKGLNVVNIGARYATSFKLGKFRLPVSVSYILNPYKEKSYVTLSLNLSSQ